MSTERRKMDMVVKPELNPSKTELEGFKKLTETEKQVMGFIAAGKTGDVIAQILGIRPKTVEAHRYNINKKLGASGTADITRIWMQLGETDHQVFEDGLGI